MKAATVKKGKKQRWAKPSELTPFQKLMFYEAEEKRKSEEKFKQSVMYATKQAEKQ